MFLEYVIKTSINVYVLCKLITTPLNLQRSELTKPANVANQAPQDNAPVQHFALISMDQYGTIHHEVSPSIVQYRDTILSPQVTAEFLKTVANATEVGLRLSSLEFSSTQPFYDHLESYDSPDLRFPKETQAEGHAVPTTYGYYPQPTLWPGHNIATPAILKDKVLHTKRSCMQKHSVELQEAMLPIKDAKFLRRYYERVFHNIQQTNCRVLAKAYVKFVEPHKQVKYPYNGRKAVAGEIQQLSSEQTKPPWWPPQVRHREPDHLLKAERIALLLHILCDLRCSHGVTSQKLKDAEQSVRSQIIPVGRLEPLYELYRVRGEEEKFLEGLLGRGLQPPILHNLTKYI
ncbi:hypothetical protein N7530_008668 [Penicillium desertorum]|uniref:Subtelomeric hrmA-associated cluster protein AFUB-079030/YDR124W-like helical bundle domain-containing protein n=1 Tax=Penicillium desertorum TaxID=1303715 RepID=A0A9W9WPV0_9EURO|nr:hypothetical protein N7530_008668 [Penicillium desertorum]